MGLSRRRPNRRRLGLRLPPFEPARACGCIRVSDRFEAGMALSGFNSTSVSINE